MKLGRWVEVTESEYPWEREALGYLRERLPDTEPFRAWSNFEFIAEDGSINEVDLLVVSLTRSTWSRSRVAPVASPEIPARGPGVTTAGT